jgi:hypothetical protein
MNSCEIIPEPGGHSRVHRAICVSPHTVNECDGAARIRSYGSLPEDSTIDAGLAGILLRLRGGMGKTNSKREREVPAEGVKHRSQKMNKKQGTQEKSEVLDGGVKKIKRESGRKKNQEKESGTEKKAALKSDKAVSEPAPKAKKGTQRTARSEAAPSKASNLSDEEKARRRLQALKNSAEWWGDDNSTNVQDLRDYAGIKIFSGYEMEITSEISSDDDDEVRVCTGGRG